jgi:hypothetical protein
MTDAVGTPSAQRTVDVPFEAHVELLRTFLARRQEIVERVQGLLNAQRRPQHYLQDAALLSRHFEDCLFTLAGLTPDRLRLRRQLDEAHWVSGFRPRETPGVHNDLVDAGEMMSCAFHLWQQTRWPGRNARVRYAHTLLALHVIRQLALLVMRLWDAGPAQAAPRLARAQEVLDELWRSAPADQPVLVRDARWLIPVAQSPTTDELWGYYGVLERLAESLTPDDRIAIHSASVRMAGGHLRSQLRHVTTKKGVALDDHGVLLSTRNSNALDIGTILQALVPLLEAYEQAVATGGEQRLPLASAICQAISPDPELFVNRLDLLAPYTMIEHLFITSDASGRVIYTPMGRRHLRLVAEYETLMSRVAGALLTDCPHFRPVAGRYSPYGVLFGFSSRLFEHMALKVLSPEAITRFGLEDVFEDGDADKLAWVSGWRNLPHVPREVLKLYEYPQRFAEEVYARIEQALQRRAAEGAGSGKRGRLRILPEGAAQDSATPPLPPGYFRSSDPQIVAAGRAEPWDRAQMLRSRLEGELLVSYETASGWIAISKDVITDVLGTGAEAHVVGLPPQAAGVLALMCRGLATLEYTPSPLGDEIP